MYVARVMNKVLPVLTLTQLARRVKEARYAAAMLQRLFQTSFFRLNGDLECDLRKQAFAVQRDFWEVKTEYETLWQTLTDAQRQSRPSLRLASNFAKLMSDVERVKWYEEDAHLNAKRISELELELSAAKQKIEQMEIRHAARTAELLAEIETTEGKYHEACGDNIELYDENVALEAENKELKKVARHTQTVDFLRGKLKEYIDCAAREAVLPKSMALLLPDGNPEQRAKAVRVLKARAQHAPLEVAQTEGVITGLLQTIAEDQEQSVAAAGVLLVLAEHDALVFFERVPNLGRYMLDLCRDEDVRRVAWQPLARLLRLLTLRSGGGVLDTKPKQAEFCTAMTVLWPKTTADLKSAATTELVGTMANLSQMDHTLFAHNPRTMDRLLPLLCVPKPAFEVLLTLRVLARVDRMRKMILEHEAALPSILCCMRGKSDEVRLERIEATRLLAALGDGDDAALGKVLQARPHDLLQAMAESEVQDEYEQAMRTIRGFLTDFDFCLSTLRCLRFTTVLVYRVIDSDTAFATLASLLARANDAFDEFPNREIGYAARCDFLNHVLEIDSRLKDVINHHLFHPSSTKRRLDAIKIVGVLASSRPQAEYVAAYHMPGIEACMRSARSQEERNWSVHAVAQVYTSCGPKPMIDFPGLLNHLVKMVGEGVGIACTLLVLITRREECARAFGKNRVLRHRLFYILTKSSSEMVRDRAAMALAEIYDYNPTIEDGEFFRTNVVKRALEEMKDFRSPMQGDGENGANRLAAHLQQRRR